MKLDFDTGSSDLWVASTELPNTTQASLKAGGHNIFNSAISHTYKPLADESWNITYGDGSMAAGNVGTDVLKIGNTIVPSQAIELATKESSSFRKGASDGLLGLAIVSQAGCILQPSRLNGSIRHGSLIHSLQTLLHSLIDLSLTIPQSSLNTVTPTQVKTPVENMIATHAISQPLFTARLTSNKNPKEEPFYTFGAIDEEAVRATGSTIHYTPVDTSNGFWQFSSTSYTINGKSFVPTNKSSIADTGTTLALMDDAFVKNVYANIPGATLDQTQGVCSPADRVLA